MTSPGILVFNWVEVTSPVHEHAKMLAFRESEDIATVYLGNAAFHVNLAEVIRDEVGSATLLAAGDVDRSGTVTSWKSSGFAFETPLEVRDAIAHLIREHAKEIEDFWVR